MNQLVNFVATSIQGHDVCVYVCVSLCEHLCVAVHIKAIGTIKKSMQNVGGK